MPVIPAEAGIQSSRLEAAGAPAVFNALDPRLRGDDEEGAGMTKKARG